MLATSRCLHARDGASVWLRRDPTAMSDACNVIEPRDCLGYWGRLAIAVQELGEAACTQDVRLRSARSSGWDGAGRFESAGRPGPHYRPGRCWFRTLTDRILGRIQVYCPGVLPLLVFH